MSCTESVETLVIGGGQAGLAVGYYLRQRGLRFIILDASERTGNSWRRRWDSLRVFTPARFNGLPGMAFPAAPRSYPTKDECADFLEAYAKQFELSIRHRVRVDRLWKEGDRFVAVAGERRFEAAHVVVAMSSYQQPYAPPFAEDLDSNIVQLHSSEYKNPSQLREGGVLVVGASDSGGEISLEASKKHHTWLSGRFPPEVPFRVDSTFGRFVGVPFVIGLLFQHVLNTSTPVGRVLRSKVVARGVGPNVRVKRRDIAAAGIENVPRTSGVRGGRPLLEDDRVLDVSNVIWCTGFRPDFTWIDLPVFGGVENPKEPLHDRGIVDSQPGLYFVGLFFTYALSSSLFRGIGRDAGHVVKRIAAGRTTQLI